jgi:nucleotide-binding universal stress UspA family protein
LDQVVSHLARRGITAKLQRLTPPGQCPGQHSVDRLESSIDLLVMGGYGHSRLQERILGGVTRGMFRSMTVPALMSH